ncbi:MAG: hypothetical protein QM757_26455 [Paludibaculum sp.]
MTPVNLGQDQITVAWKPFPGMQVETLQRTEDEIFCGGSRGPGKSAVQIAAGGRMAVEKDEKGRAKYPDYRGLLVREKYDDLRKLIDDAKKLYSKFGAVAKDDPVEFWFPGGPILYTGFLRGDAWQKYQGWNLHWFGVDEAGQIPDTYFQGNMVWPVEMVMASVRGSPNGLNQSLLTGNPGNCNDRRLKERYTRVKDINGRVIPPKTTILDPVSGKTRIFIPGFLTDNPWLLENDKGYIARLLAMPEQVRRAWIYGDWDSYDGAYFGDFRPNGPISTSEPAWACHVVRRSELRMAPWWWRWMSLDWGYGHYAAGYKFCQNPNGQVVVYDELVRQKTSSFQLGIDVGNWLMQDLVGMPEGNLLLYLSPDAIDQRRDATNTIAEQISLGIQAVLGKGGSWIAVMTEDEKEIKKADPARALEMMRRRQVEEQGKYSVTIVRANNNRVAGWNYCRDMMRFTPTPKASPDWNYVNALLKSHHGEMLVRQYLAQFDEAEETLPLSVITDNCKRLREWIPTAIPDPKRVEDVLKVEGDDFGDGWRYGMIAHSDNKAAMPRAQFLADRISAVEKGLIGRGYTLEDPTTRAHVMMTLNNEWDRDHAGPMESFNLPRGCVQSPYGQFRPN